MKNFKYTVTTLLLVLCIIFSFGCYMVSSQTMKNVKGTYKLTRYTYTPKYERKDDYTPTTTDYIADEGYEVYLVVTGTGEGYYAHKDNATAAYVTIVSLSYEYDEEDSSKVKFVRFAPGIISEDSDDEWDKFGVTKNKLNYSKTAFDYQELITKKNMRSSAIHMDWEKVDDATDLSYVTKKLGEMPVPISAN